MLETIYKAEEDAVSNGKHYSSIIYIAQLDFKEAILAKGGALCALSFGLLGKCQNWVSVPLTTATQQATSMYLNKNFFRISKPKHFLFLLRTRTDEKEHHLFNRHIHTYIQHLTAINL